MKLIKSWATAIAKNASENNAIIYRFAQDFDIEEIKSSHMHRVIIVWEYVGNNGMPDALANKKMDFFENTVTPYLDADEFAILAIVSTGDSLREWTYYSKSENEFFARLNSALKDQEYFPIKLHAALDENWTTYNDFKQTIALS